MSIKKRNGRYVVLSKSGNKVLGVHSSRAKALKQLRAIEMKKRRKGNG